MKQVHTILLSPLQVEILLDAIQGFVDNKKLLHVPNKQGEIVGLPITREALRHISAVIGDKDSSDKQEIHIEMEKVSEQATKVQLSVDEQSLDYEVDLDEFDPV